MRLFCPSHVLPFALPLRTRTATLKGIFTRMGTTRPMLIAVDGTH